MSDAGGAARPGGGGRWWRRLNAFDVAAAAIALLGAVALLVQVRGYRFAGDVDHGFMRQVPLRVAIELRPPFSELAAELPPGRLRVEGSRGLLDVRVIGVSGPPEPRLVVELEASVDASGRSFFGGQRIRRGNDIALASPEVRVAGVIVAIERLDAR